MIDDLKKDKNLYRILVTLLIIAVGSYVLGIFWQFISNFSDLLIILVFAWLLSFILEPLVERLSKILGLSKPWAGLIVYLVFAGIFIAAVFLLLPEVIRQIQNFIKLIPSYSQNNQYLINRFSGLLTTSLNTSILLIPSVAQFLFSLFLVFIFSFYFIIDKEKIIEEAYDLSPNSWHKTMRYIQSVIVNTFSSFLRVQLIFGVATGIFTWILLRILDVDFAASSSVLAGVFAAIPLIGPIIAVIPPVFVAFLVDPIEALIIFSAIVIFEQLLFNVIGPKLLGNAFKIHPAIIILSFLIGMKVAGGTGAVFAIPVLGVLVIVIRKLGRDFFKRNKELTSPKE